MERTLEVNDQITIGGQPSEAELMDLGSRGFRSIVNFRNADEDDHSLSPDFEGDIVKAGGMTYVHIPVTMKAMDARQVDEFRSRYPDLPKPVFGHCKSGKRAGAMALMMLAVADGITGDQAIQRAEELRIDCDQPELKAFIIKYVDSHLKSPPMTLSN
ncbi:MAG: hypothetical protein JWM11_5637 [Planctomycetaceae bacterium]|nr:hypothetical protein [Planctomycetaceae bacterium]